MNDGFKQRLVGAIVLICMALILWPWVFSDPNSQPMDRRSQIPDLPAFEKYSVPEPARPDNIEPIERVDLERPVQPTINTSAAADVVIEDKPKLDNRGLPESWVLQVGSFSKKTKASELKRALQKKGYKAYTRTAGSSTRVYVGPKISKSALIKDKSLIDKEYKVDSLIIRFKP